MKLRLRHNGSLVFDLPEGAAFTLDGERRVLPKPKLALCRCGLSAQKPFCDGSHKGGGLDAGAGEIEFGGEPG